MAIVMRAIRPRRFKGETYRQYAIVLAKEVEKEALGDFEKTVDTWEHKPKFEHEHHVDDAGVEVLVGTDDEIYGYVNYGTKRHPIYAGIYTGKSDKKVLAFPSSFTPKTTPNVIGSGPGGSGGNMVFTPYVDHPGTKARNFDKIIAKKWEKRLRQRVLKLTRDFVRASNHYAG